MISRYVFFLFPLLMLFVITAKLYSQDEIYLDVYDADGNQTHMKVDEYQLRSSNFEEYLAKEVGEPNCIKQGQCYKCGEKCIPIGSQCDCGKKDIFDEDIKKNKKEYLDDDIK